MTTPATGGATDPLAPPPLDTRATPTNRAEWWGTYSLRLIEAAHRALDEDRDDDAMALYARHREALREHARWDRERRAQPVSVSQIRRGIYRSMTDPMSGRIRDYDDGR
ncbi:MAG: hypothetical protein M0P31_14020 [Solirubrobacteraceae bacterium]|nr:hypothetical protein [Solirubrobacteraceae bacterium]